ncbi:MAG: hypothetical protein K2X38_00195 [Gemmataceae bacterium]|nr:hypothetical protein [Gemmataceae bacterium]
MTKTERIETTVERVEQVTAPPVAVPAVVRPEQPAPIVEPPERAEQPTVQASPPSPPPLVEQPQAATPAPASSGPPSAPPPAPSLSQDEYQSLVRQFGATQAQQIMSATGVQAPPPMEAAPPKQAAPASPLPVAEPSAAAPPDDFDPMALAQARIERERKMRLVDEAYRELAPPPPDLPFDPAEAARKRVEREENIRQAEAEYKKLKPPEPEPAFDPLEAAKRRVEREEQQALAEAEYRKLKPPAAEPPFDPVEVAKKRIEREEQFAQADAEYRRMKPPEPEPAFDPVAVARRRMEAEDQRKAAQEAYESMRPEKPFDPYESANKQFEGAVRGEQIKAAFEEMYGAAEKGKGALDQTLDFAEAMRGTVGGVFGTLVGAALDVTALVRRYRADQETPPARLEAERRNAAMTAAPPSPPPLEPKEQPKPLEPLEVGGKRFEWQDAPDLKKQQSEDKKPGASTVAVDPSKGAGESAAEETARTGSLSAGLRSAAMKMGPMGVAAAAATVGITAMTKAANEFDSAIMSRVERLSDYSPQLAMAKANVDMQRQFADMQRGQDYGPQLARYLQVRADVEQKWEDVKMQMLEALMPIAETLMVTVGEIAKILENAPWNLVTKLMKKISENTEPQQDTPTFMPGETIMGQFMNVPQNVSSPAVLGGSAMVTPNV